MLTKSEFFVLEGIRSRNKDVKKKRLPFILKIDGFNC